MLLLQGSLVYTRERLLSLKTSISTEISSLGGHLGLSRLIQGLDRQLEGLDLAPPPEPKPGSGARTGSREGATLDSW